EEPRASLGSRLHACILSAKLAEHVALSAETTACRLLCTGLCTTRRDADLLHDTNLLRAIDDLDLEIEGAIEDVDVGPLVRTERDVRVVADLRRVFDVRLRSSPGRAEAIGLAPEVHGAAVEANLLRSSIAKCTDDLNGA